MNISLAITDYVDAVDRRDPDITDEDIDKVRQFREGLISLREAFGYGDS